MAITIHQEPQSYSPIFNDLIYVVSSTNTGQSNFQYLCDVYLTDDAGAVSFGANTYLRLKAPTDPTYTSGVINVGRAIENFVSYDIGDAIYGSQKSNNSIIRLQCKFGEEYGPSSGVTAYANLTNSSTISVWNGAFQFLQFKDFSAADFTGNTASNTKRFLTERPTSGTIRTDENAWLSVLSANNNEVYWFKILIWKNNGALQKSYRIKNNYPAVSSAGRRFIRFPAGPKNIPNIPAADFDTTYAGDDAGPIVWNTANYQKYEITVAESTTLIVRERQWYLVDEPCTDFTIYRLHFLNKYGGFDSFSFIRESEKTIDIKKDKFKKRTLKRLGGGSYGYDKSDLSDVNFNTQYKEKIKIHSDWIDGNTSTWLIELLTAPVIFHDDATHGLIAINIIETNYAVKTWLRDKLFDVQLTFEYTFEQYRQRQ